MKSKIILYADEFDYDTWAQYCDICGVHRSATAISILFKEKDVMAAYEDEDEDEDEDEEEYIPSAENGDYSPGNPWDAPGMLINDFI